MCEVLVAVVCGARWKGKDLACLGGRLAMMGGAGCKGRAQGRVRVRGCVVWGGVEGRERRRGE